MAPPAGLVPCHAAFRVLHAQFRASFQQSLHDFVVAAVLKYIFQKINGMMDRMGRRWGVGGEGREKKSHVIRKHGAKAGPATRARVKCASSSFTVANLTACRRASAPWTPAPSVRQWPRNVRSARSLSRGGRAAHVKKKRPIIAPHTKPAMEYGRRRRRNPDESRRKKNAILTKLWGGETTGQMHRQKRYIYAHTR